MRNAGWAANTGKSEDIVGQEPGLDNTQSGEEISWSKKPVVLSK